MHDYANVVAHTHTHTYTCTHTHTHTQYNYFYFLPRLRAQFGSDIKANAIHGSSSALHAEESMKLIFGDLKFNPDGTVKKPGICLFLLLLLWCSGSVILARKIFSKLFRKQPSFRKQRLINLNFIMELF